MADHIQVLRALLRSERGVLLPGAPNALAARIVEDLGFKAVYLTGAGLTNMHLGLPDLGFMDLSQATEHVIAIRGVVELPLIVDIGSGPSPSLTKSSHRSPPQRCISAYRRAELRRPAPFSS